MMKAKMNTQILSRVSQYQAGWGKFSLQSTMPVSVQVEKTQDRVIINIHHMHVYVFNKLYFCLLPIFIYLF